MSPRRLIVLIKGLPVTARVNASSRERWGPDEYLLANAVDLLSLIRIEAMKIAGVKQTPEFHPVTRPGDVIEDPAEKAAADARAEAMLPGIAPPKRRRGR